MKRTNKNRQAEYLQTGKSERTAVRAAKCVTDYGQENTLPVHTKVCGLAENKLYRCSLDGEIRSGRTWNRAGLTLHQVLKEYESIRVEFTEVE